MLRDGATVIIKRNNWEKADVLAMLEKAEAIKEANRRTTERVQDVLTMSLIVEVHNYYTRKRGIISTSGLSTR